MDFEGAKSYILKALEELNPKLYYHDLSHTHDVLNSAERIARLENVSDSEAVLLKTAALYHDSGMLRTYNGHEEAACQIVSEVLPGFGYSNDQTAHICRMIMTTKLPQSASGKLEQIICDADLDYLGREDFFMISHRLKLEWNIQNIYVTTLKQWYELQVQFLESHTYFTKSAIDTRKAGKQQNLEQIKELICLYD
jgi:predicted metal-dependent HD superfamily phosphohydrolase